MTTRSRLPEIEGVLVFEMTWAGNLSQKLTTLGFGAAMWAIWGSLWLPTVTAAIWAVAPAWGIDQAWDAWQDACLTLGLILVVGLAMGALLGLWGTVQLLAGQSAARPEPIPSITLEELAAFHRLEQEMLRSAWTSRRLVIHHDGDGQVTDIEMSLPIESTSSDQSPEQDAALIGLSHAEGCGTPVPCELETPGATKPVFGPNREHANMGGVLVWVPESLRKEPKPARSRSKAPSVSKDLTSSEAAIDLHALPTDSAVIEVSEPEPAGTETPLPASIRQHSNLQGVLVWSPAALRKETMTRNPLAADAGKLIPVMEASAARPAETEVKSALPAAAERQSGTDTSSSGRASVPREASGVPSQREHANMGGVLVWEPASVRKARETRQSHSRSSALCLARECA